jgi:hypothetical protein
MKPFKRNGHAYLARLSAYLQSVVVIFVAREMVRLS